MRRFDEDHDHVLVSCCCQASHLNTRDVEVLVLVARGYSNDAIARAMHVSRQTVATRVSDMLRRARVTNRAELVARAFVAGVLTPVEWPPQATGKRCVIGSEPVLAR